MAKQINENTWQCSYCKKMYHSILMADGCEKTHDIVLVPLKRSDLMRLIQYLYTDNKDLLTESLIETLNEYSRVKKQETSDGLSGVWDEN